MEGRGRGGLAKSVEIDLTDEGGREIGKRNAHYESICTCHFTLHFSKVNKYLKVGTAGPQTATG